MKMALNGNRTWGDSLMQRVKAFALILGVVSASIAAAQDVSKVPQVALLEAFAEFEETRKSDPQAAFEIADKILAEAEDPDLRLVFGRAALNAGDGARARAYLEPLVVQLERTDPRLTEVLDLLVAAFDLLGLEEEALQHALAAYDTAEARLGAENPALLARLDALEPRAEKLQPDLLPLIAQLRDAIPTEPPAPGTVRAEGDPTAVEVWYGTNRVATGSKDPAQFYGTELGALRVGTLTVTIPPGHLAGLIERPEGWFFTDHLDPDKHVVLAGLQELTRDAFAEGCCGEQDRLLFVHGYNVSFHDGALRAAQLAFDLEFPGQAMYYSWPSKSSLYGYLSDSNNVVPSRPAMEAFLEMATRGNGKLHIIAHSMGNRYTLEALETFLLRNPDRRIGQLILAAPDVDRAEFQARFGGIRDKADGVTLYASRHDLALQVSRRVNGGYRLGDANGDVVRLAGLDTVDASQIEADSLGHSYFGDAPQLLGDILGVVRLGWAPRERCGVAERESGEGGNVWEVRPDGCPVEQIRTAGDLIRTYGGDALKEARRRFDKAPGDRMDFWLGVLDVMEARLGE
ncbi:Esterase/lipase superfamily enzyme [Shimia aestuarii]|uniref:Esterase/lipase superfamily enzyme n=2 Tax=Shimia aestuarii TaxID=254406 RepID=A0A1I4P8J2_9RHOB|nr:Esterase/lipase superfamily enzyme [Shimia aestuarii]